MAQSDDAAEMRRSADYPWPWSVYRWLDGKVAHPERIVDLSTFAADLAAFLSSLQQIDPADGPPPGPHSFFRGAPLDVYDAETRRAIAAARDLIDAEAATRLWETGLAAPFAGPPVWFHGDVAASRLRRHALPKRSDQRSALGRMSQVW